MGNIITLIIIANAVLAIVLQAVFPNRRHIIMFACATVALVLATLKYPMSTFLGSLPWDTVLILFALTIFGEFIFGSRLFNVLIRKIATLCRGKTYLILIVFNIIVFIVSSVLNNYQALLIVLPALLGILKLVDGLNKWYLTILFSSILIISNLAGASTPIGDFPALYLLSQGVITFSSYFANATPFAVLAATAIILLSVFFYRIKPAVVPQEAEKLSVAYTEALYRNVKLNKQLLYPSIVVFAGMFAFWLLGYNPTKVALLGLSALAIIIKSGKYAEEKVISTDPSIFIYFISLFIIIASIQQTGILNCIADYLKTIENPKVLLIVFSCITVLVTGFVSAGPSTVAFFPIAVQIAPLYADNVVITCFCLSICAGSSLFLTAATAGPLLTQMTEKYPLSINGNKYLFSFKDYLIPGIIGAGVIFLSNILYIFIHL